jgi:outer membrane protein OmpA-like peptidoglycan-associated protein
MSIASAFRGGPNLNDIGFYFCDSLIGTTSIDTILQPSKYIGFLDSKTRRPNNGWFRIEKEFTAEDNSGIIIIGNFSGKDYQKIVNDRDRSSKYVTILIDDLEIVPVEKVLCQGCEKTRDSIYTVSKNQTCKINLINAVDSIPEKTPVPIVDTVLISSDLLFESNSFTITQADSLEFVLGRLKNKNLRKITIIGFTDDTGTEKYNRELSLKRAKSVAAYISDKFRIPPVLIEAEGAGISTKFKDRKLNRRVEIYVYIK